MKKKILKVIIMFSLFVLLIGIKNTVQANSISSVSMDIYIDSNGNAKVTEKWDCYTSQGTECYHPYYNLGKSKITNLTVSDKKQSYTTLEFWDTSGTLSSKAYKCGINNINNGIELCWGISSYGSNVYTVKYNITNFVSQLTDSQMIYWTLIPYDFSTSIGSVKIKIYSDDYFEDTLDVWGYGNYGGLCYVDDGAIYMDSDGTLSTSEYMTILVNFPDGTFNASNTLDYDFNHYYEMAQDGAKSYSKNSVSNTIFAIIITITSLTVWCLPFVLVLVAAKISGAGKYGFYYGEAGKKIPKNVDYQRDIPCNGDVFRSYYIAYQYKLIKNKTDILGAIILKWLKEGIIRTENREGGKIFKKESTVIILGDNKDRDLGNTRENEVFRMIYTASEDGILENKEFEKWCKNNYTRILRWFDDILKDQKEKLVSEGLITCETKGIFKSKKYTATQELKDEAVKLAGIKRFLLDYTLIKSREAIEVELFEDYLIYAQILGIAKQVSKQFKELYPEMIEQTNYGSYDNIVFINSCASRGISSANSARAAAESYSSGGGGFSSGGGGGGSFGGGGGRRRIPLEYVPQKKNYPIGTGYFLYIF